MVVGCDTLHSERLYNSEECAISYCWLDLLLEERLFSTFLIGLRVDARKEDSNSVCLAVHVPSRSSSRESYAVQLHQHHTPAIDRGSILPFSTFEFDIPEKLRLGSIFRTFTTTMAPNRGTNRAAEFDEFLETGAKGVSPVSQHGKHC